MSAQTTYSLNISKGLAGQIYDLSTSVINSYSVETAAGADFGIAVSRGTDKERQVVIGASDLVGITVRSLDREGVGSTSEIKYAQKETVGTMAFGHIYVVCPTGCTAGDAVKATTATGVLDAGAASAGETQLDGAKWETTTAAGEVGVISITSVATTAGA